MRALIVSLGWFGDGDGEEVKTGEDDKEGVVGCIDDGVAVALPGMD